MTPKITFFALCPDGSVVTRNSRNFYQFAVIAKQVEGGIWQKDGSWVALSWSSRRDSAAQRARQTQQAMDTPGVLASEIYEEVRVVEVTTNRPALRLAA